MPGPTCNTKLFRGGRPKKELQQLLAMSKNKKTCNNTKQEKKENEELRLSDAELGSVLNLELFNESDSEALRELVYSLSLILYKSFEHEKS